MKRTLLRALVMLVVAGPIGAPVASADPYYGDRNNRDAGDRDRYRDDDASRYANDRGASWDREDRNDGRGNNRDRWNEHRRFWRHSSDRDDRRDGYRDHDHDEGDDRR